MDATACREFFKRNLGLRCTERVVFDNGIEIGVSLTVTSKSCDIACGRAGKGVGGWLHHITSALDSREALLRAAGTSLEAGVTTEIRPHNQGIQQAFFLHVIEPGDNRVEPAHSGAHLLLAPD